MCTGTGLAKPLLGGHTAPPAAALVDHAVSAMLLAMARAGYTVCSSARGTVALCSQAGSPTFEAPQLGLGGGVPQQALSAAPVGWQVGMCEAVLPGMIAVALVMM